MGKVTKQEVKCGNCHLVLAEFAADAPLACPDCGFVARNFSLTISGTLAMQSEIKIKSRRGGTGKPFHILKSGSSFFHKAAKWVHREMIVDRENNKYKETVIDSETGEIIRFCEEPLSNHQGRGSARNKGRQ